MSKRIVISIVLVLLLIITGTGVFFFIFRSTFTRTMQPKVVQLTSSVVHQSEEVPFSSHRAFSMVASQVATELTPWGIAIDYKHGFVWVAEPGCTPSPKCPTIMQGDLSQYALSDSNFIANFNEPSGYSSPLFAAVDREGNVWFTQPTTDALGEYDPLDNSWHQWYLKQGSSPFDLTFDSNGNLWFTEFGANDIGFFDPLTDMVVENPIPTPASNPYGITVDPQGTVWFAQNAVGVGQIGSFTPTRSGTINITEHAVSVQRPHMITTDRSGNVWYSGGFGGDIGEFKPQSANNIRFVVGQGTCLSSSACSGTHISGIAIDNQDNVWFTDANSQRVGYLLPATGQLIIQSLQDSNAHPYDGLIIDSSDRVWFTEEFGLNLSMWPARSVK
ncbi:MAG TPA: hypothetical protein VIX20_00710 [Ktedonobacteraceae bacterium]